MDNNTIHPNCMGDIGEGLLLAELVLRGLTVSIPFGHNNLYDLVVEHKKSGKLLKVQVKNRASIKGNCVRIIDIDRYIGKIDVLAILVVTDWYFISGRVLAKFSGKSNLLIQDIGSKSKFSIFGC